MSPVGWTVRILTGNLRLDWRHIMPITCRLLKIANWLVSPSMSPRITTAILVTSAVGTAGFFFLFLHAPVARDGSYGEAQNPVTKALKNQQQWLESRRGTEPTLPVHKDFSGLNPERMANCLSANGVVDFTTGLLLRPDVRFGISAAGVQKVNRWIRPALGRMATAEKASILESSGSDTLRQFMFSPNATLAESLLKDIDRALQKSFPHEVAAGLSFALRQSAALMPHTEPYKVTFSASQDGAILSFGNSFVTAIEDGLRIEGFQFSYGPGISPGSTSVMLTSFGDSLSDSSGIDLRWSHVIPPKESWPARRVAAAAGTGVQKNGVPAAFSILGEEVPAK
jgi:hypothetical protein